MAGAAGAMGIKTGKKRAGKAAELAAEPDPRAPLDSAAFLDRARPVLKLLAEDLLERARGSAGVQAGLQARHAAEVKDRRTGDPFDVWERRYVGQVAAAWLLSCVFVRTLEDRGLLDRNRVAGPGALDSQKMFHGLAPFLTERDYLLTVFGELSKHPTLRRLFAAPHNPIWRIAPSAGGAKALLELFRLPGAEAPAFRFGEPDTRFLGDLYERLDDEVRERFALLQTPRFVESFILDRTLEPAIERFGLDDVTVLDPTCGSGHFLLGAFDRLFDHRVRAAPNEAIEKAARLALKAVAGTDINPFAVFITRFRLLLVYLDRRGIAKLRAAGKQSAEVNVTVADSLLSVGPQTSFDDLAGQEGGVWRGEELTLEDEEEAKKVLGRRYAVVVGNPPYITAKDPVLRERYRAVYDSAAGKYSLAAPFTERFFQLTRERGFVGMITANSFMKREFGKALIEKVLPRLNLTGVVNTAGAYIPSCGTPTVILFGTAEPPQTGEVPVVLGKRGEPSTPDDPAQGLVWRSVADHGDEDGFENEYISVSRFEREPLSRHPWSLGGGGAVELKEILEEKSQTTLGQLAASIGIASFTLEDDVYLRPTHAWHRVGLGLDRSRPMIIGEAIRDWSIEDVPIAFFPYDTSLRPIAQSDETLRVLWPWRTNLSNNKLFGGKTKIEGGLAWYEYGRLTPDKLRTPLSITFAFVATHNHFALDRGGKVFKQSAPIIKLPETATEEDHLALLAYLNSSTACFWMKQVMQPKSVAENKDHPDQERNRFEFSGTAVGQLPVPGSIVEDQRLVAAARKLSELAALRDSQLRLLPEEATVEALLRRRQECWQAADRYREKMIVAQEEIDWLVYESFGLASARTTLKKIPDSAVCRRGDRPFERISSRQSYLRKAGERLPLASAEIPSATALTESLRPLWETRVAEIRSSSTLTLCEQPLYKRQWRDTDSNTDEFTYRREVDLRLAENRVLAVVDSLVSTENSPKDLRALRAHVQSLPWCEAILTFCRRRGEVADLASMVERSAVPFIAAMRFSEAGMEKYQAWERIWEVQRAEDRGDEVNTRPELPKYESGDFVRSQYWSLRGKLDVPKERFISYPGCESDQDGQPVYGWAGWNHLQRAQALAALYQKRKSEEAWARERLTPMLAGLLELIPWVKQWHNEASAEFGGLRLGDYFETTFLDGECRELGLTWEDLRAWRPPTRGRVRAAGAVVPPAAVAPAPKARFSKAAVGLDGFGAAGGSGKTKNGGGGKSPKRGGRAV